MILKQKLESWQYQVDQAKDPTVFTDANLANYAAVGMINTCFLPFGANRSGEAESEALERFLPQGGAGWNRVEQGGGRFGTHCADGTFQFANPVALYNRRIGDRTNSENFDGPNNCRKTGAHATVAGLPETLRTPAIWMIRTTLPRTAPCWSDARGHAERQRRCGLLGPKPRARGASSTPIFGKVDADLTNATIGDEHILSGLAWVLGR